MDGSMAVDPANWTSDDVDRHLYENAELLALILSPAVSKEDRAVFIKRLRLNVITLAEVAGLEGAAGFSLGSDIERLSARERTVDLSQSQTMLGPPSAQPFATPAADAHSSMRYPQPGHPPPPYREPDQQFLPPSAAKPKGGKPTRLPSGTAGEVYAGPGDWPAEVRLELECVKGKRNKGVLVMTRKDGPRGAVGYSQEIQCLCCGDVYNSRTNWLKHNEDKTGRVLDNIAVPKANQTLRHFAYSDAIEAPFVRLAMSFKEKNGEEMCP